MQLVNFVYNGSANYKLVQDQLFGLIEAQLPDGTTSRTVETARADAINFGIHIRISRKTNVAMPIDVLMSHGLADKSYLLAEGEDGRRLVNSYEHVIVAGEWFRSRLRHWSWHPTANKRVTIPADRIHIGGWPRIDHFFRGDDREVHLHKPRLLWAPSHNISTREQSFSSYPAFGAYLERLAEDFDVRVSLHPSNRTDKTPTHGDLNWADIVISDFGTLLYEGWAARKCVIIPTWLIPREISQGSQRYSAEGYIFRKAIGNHAGSFDQLVRMAMARAAPDARVEALMTKILDPRYRGWSAKRIAELLQTLPVARLGS